MGGVKKPGPRRHIALTEAEYGALRSALSAMLETAPYKAQVQKLLEQVKKKLIVSQPELRYPLFLTASELEQVGRHFPEQVEPRMDALGPRDQKSAELTRRRVRQQARDLYAELRPEVRW